MKYLSAAITAITLFTFPAAAQDTVQGKFRGLAQANAQSYGSTIDSGQTMHEAGQFSGVNTTLRFDPRHGEGDGDSRDGITVMGTVDAFTTGFTKGFTKGASSGWAARRGKASGQVEFDGDGSDHW